MLELLSVRRTSHRPSPTASSTSTTSRPLSTPSKVNPIPTIRQQRAHSRGGTSMRTGRSAKRGRLSTMTPRCAVACTLLSFPPVPFAFAAECTCVAAKLSNAWCESCKVGYLAGLRIPSERLFDTLDAHGHDYPLPWLLTLHSPQRGPVASPLRTQHGVLSQERRVFCGRGAHLHVAGRHRRLG